MSVCLPKFKENKNRAVWDVTECLLTNLDSHLSRVKYSDQQGNPYEKRAEINMVTDIDFYDQPFNGQQFIPSDPSICVGLPDIEESLEGYNGMVPVDQLPGEGGGNFGKRMSPSSFYNLVYRMKLISQNTIVLQDMMTDFTRVFRGIMSELTVLDKANNCSETYLVDVRMWPQGSNVTPNASGHYEVPATIAINGVEFTTGEVQSFPVVKDLCVRAFGFEPDATYQAEIINGDEIFISQILEGGSNGD